MALYVIFCIGKDIHCLLWQKYLFLRHTRSDTESPISGGVFVAPGDAVRGTVMGQERVVTPLRSRGTSTRSINLLQRQTLCAKSYYEHFPIYVIGSHFRN